MNQMEYSVSISFQFHEFSTVKSRTRDPATSVHWVLRYVCSNRTDKIQVLLYDTRSYNYDSILTCFQMIIMYFVLSSNKPFNYSYPSSMFQLKLSSYRIINQLGSTNRLPCSAGCECTAHVHATRKRGLGADSPRIYSFYV